MRVPIYEPWWAADKTEIHTKVFTQVEWLEQRQGQQHTANLHHLRLYSNRMANALSGQSVLDAMDMGERIRLNVVKSAIDAAVVQIATNKTRPMFLTNKGNYELRKRAERLGRFVLGQFYALRHYENALEVFRDAAVFGTGWLKVYAKNGYLCSERVLDDELIVDEEESRTGKPRAMFHKKNDVSRSKLAYFFPKYRDIIEQSAREDAYRMTQGAESGNDQTTVIEGWLLPSAPGAGDGRHIICLNTGVLVDEEWMRDAFPLVPFRWSTSPIGFRGIGAAEELSPIQVEINYILQKIQKLMTLATSMVWKEKGSIVGKLDNQDWGQREYTGKPPIFQTTAAVSAEYFHHLDRLYNRAYEIVGISQLSASSQKPAGLDSGEALRVYNDIGTRRFMHVGQRWEQFHLDVAEQLLECAREIYEEGEDFAVLAQGDKDVEEINFSEVYIEKDKYRMRAYPVSIIPDEPAGKIELMERLSAAVPTMGPAFVRAISGIPDVEAAMSLENAPLEIAELYVNNILEHGKYAVPTSYFNLQLTLEMATKARLRAEIEDVPEERIELLERFIEAVAELKAKELQPPAAATEPTPPEMMGPEAAAPLPPGGEGMEPGMMPPEAGPPPVAV